MTNYSQSMRDALELVYTRNQEKIAELNEKMSSAQIAKLKKAYEPMRNKKISTSNADKLSKLMDKVGKDKEVLIQIVKADIPFVSQSAVTKLITKHNMKGAEINKFKEEFNIESVELDEGRMKELHGYIAKGMSAAEIAKKMKLDVKTIKALMDEVDLDEAVLKGRDYEYDEKKGVVKISKKNFAKVRKDAKGTDKSKPTMMVLTNKGTSLVPVQFEEVELDEAKKVTKKERDRLEDLNQHGLLALKLTQAYGTPAEVKKIKAINKRHEQKGHIERKDQKERDAISNKYYCNNTK